MRVVRFGHLGIAALAAVILGPAAAQACLDADGDRVCNADDNCRVLANPTQIDTDLDGFGNLCDGDFNNDGVVDALDSTQYFKPSAGRADPDPAYDVHVDTDES